MEQVVNEKSPLTIAEDNAKELLKLYKKQFEKKQAADNEMRNLKIKLHALSESNKDEWFPNGNNTCVFAGFGQLEFVLKTEADVDPGFDIQEFVEQFPNAIKATKQAFSTTGIKAYQTAGTWDESFGVKLQRVRKFQVEVPKTLRQ